MLRHTHFIAVVLLALFCAQAWSNPFSGAGDVARGMREAEKARDEARLRQLDIQEANRKARIQQLEHQVRMMELEQRKRELEANRQNQNTVPATRGGLQIAANLQEAAPFEVAQGIILTRASAPTSNRLFVNLQFVDFKRGDSLGGSDLPLGSDKAFLTQISCEDAAVSQLMQSGGLIFFNLFDKEDIWIGQRYISFADCERPGSGR